MACTLQFEEELRVRGFSPVAGIDEVGRGALAGPVLAAAVILPEGFENSRLDDSKRLSPAVREALYEEMVEDTRVIWAVAQAGVEEIDQINILRATHLAMRRAVEALPSVPSHCLIDGLPVPSFPFIHTAIVGGDGLSLSIAAASVIAKVTRDRIMVRMEERHPGYGFAAHKGYATREHRDKIQAHGPCEIHRRTFEPIAQSTFRF